MIAGVSNLIGSVVLGIYLLVYKQVWGVTANLELRGKWIFKYPVLVIRETAMPAGLLKHIF
jgi:hypothetical protein